MTKLLRNRESMLTLAGLVALGVAGLAIVARAAAFYGGVAATPFVIVLVMAVAFTFGIVELALHTVRTSLLEDEMTKLPHADAAHALELASPPLRTLLRAKLERANVNVPMPAFTPYIVGTLVMLGLLGTFLGLFETLHGAREALRASADVAALRDGMAAPMGGLMIAFGASAAGVSTSALLGLGAVLGRRRAQRLSFALHELASGPLAALAPASRQLVALEALSLQGQALPAAAVALADAARELRVLESAWRGSHEGAVKETARLLESTVREVDRTISKGVTETARVSHAASAVVLEKATQAIIAAQAGHLRDVLGAVDRDLETRRAQDLGAIARIDAHAAETIGKLDAMATRRAEADAAILARLEAHAEALDRKAEARGEEQRAMWESIVALRAEADEALLARLREHADQLASAESKRAESTAQHWQELRELARESLASTGPLVESAIAGATTAAEKHLNAVLEALNDAEAARRTADEASAVELASRTRDVLSELQRSREELHEHASASMRQVEAHTVELMERLTEADRARRTSEGELLAEIGSFSKTAAERDAARDEAVTRTTEILRERLVAMAAAQEESMTRTTELLDRHATASTDMFTSSKAQAEAISELVDNASRALSQLEEKSAARIGELAKIVREAAAATESGGAEMTAVAEMFGSAVDRQRDAAEEWLRNLGDVERAVTTAGEAAAVDVLGQYLARTHEVFDRQLRFQQELFEQLRATRPQLPAPGRSEASATV